MSPRFSSKGERDEIAALLRQQAEAELDRADPATVELQRLASSLEKSQDPSWPSRLMERFGWAFKRGGTHS